jgi:hypothetical protein
MNLEKRRKEIEARLTEIRSLVEAESDVAKLEAFDTECNTLQEERSVIDKKMMIASKVEIKPIVIDTRTDNKEALELRGKQLRENRVIQVSSSEVLVPETVSNTLAPVPYAQVSTLVDKVNIVNLNGGETYKKSFVKSNGIAVTALRSHMLTETPRLFFMHFWAVDNPDKLAYGLRKALGLTNTIM